MPTPDTPTLTDGSSAGPSSEPVSPPAPARALPPEHGKAAAAAGIAGPNPPESDSSPASSSSQSPARSPSPLPAPPTISAPDHTQAAAIDASLSKRRWHRPALFRSHSSDSFDPEAERAAIAHDTEECARAYRHIELEVNGRVMHTEAELPRPPKITKAHYAWEVMYENQRGISIFGKTWYSSNSLLPSDPTPFTLPLTSPGGDFILARPGASDTPAIEGARRRDTGGAEPHQAKKGRRIHRKSIKTGYCLATYQTPSPAWAWLTPWMANMRPDTDQQGWRYNLWFHTSQWAPHPGRLNWWGWVRRREWVRLRALLPPEPEEEEPEEGVHEPETLDEVMRTERPIANMTKYLATQALDREKLVLWEKWVARGSAGARHKLAALFEDKAKVSAVRVGAKARGGGQKNETEGEKEIRLAALKLVFISRAFIYPTARKAFYHSLVSAGIVEEQDCMECVEDEGYEIE